MKKRNSVIGTQQSSCTYTSIVIVTACKNTLQVKSDQTPAWRGELDTKRYLQPRNYWQLTAEGELVPFSVALGKSTVN